MKSIILSFFMFLNIVSDKSLIGAYTSTNAGFEWHSVLFLKDNQVFNYSYGISGCQGRISGKWDIEGNKLIFIYDEEYTTEYLLKQNQEFQIWWDSLASELSFDSENSFAPICYPDLNKGNWVITKKGLNQKKHMDCACWDSHGAHKKY